MSDSTLNPDDVVKFVRRRDYKFVRELGKGACGRTVLLFDDQLEQFVVCKKYEPAEGLPKEQLFDAFKREIKLLHSVLHPNVVRVFSHYLYPEQFLGYLLMEHVDGKEIDAFLKENPNQINEAFVQTISGFAHLEKNKILHRDIRPRNIMVSADGVVKIIDLGFGKQVETPSDFDKSITLNWCFDRPAEFAQHRYDFTSEVYFVGKLFESFRQPFDDFQFGDVLEKMTKFRSDDRAKSFSDVQSAISGVLLDEVEFAPEDLATYQRFADALKKSIASIYAGETPYVADPGRILAGLSDAHRKCMLHSMVPDFKPIARCFISTIYKYHDGKMSVSTLAEFIKLLDRSSEQRRKLIVENLWTMLDTVRREQPDDLPF